MVSDEQLVARAQHGDTAATDALMARYERAALWNAAQFYDHTADREDLAQEARVGLFKAVRDYQPSLGAFNPFAFLCIRRQIITAVKTSTRGKHSALTHAVRVVSNDEGDQVQAVARIEAARATRDRRAHDHGGDVAARTRVDRWRRLRRSHLPGDR